MRQHPIPFDRRILFSLQNYIVTGNHVSMQEMRPRMTRKGSAKTRPVGEDGPDNSSARDVTMQLYNPIESIT
jgi:hypothetical protein